MSILGQSVNPLTKATALEGLRQQFEGDMLSAAHSELAGRVVHGLEALDVVQEVFTELLLSAKAEKFDTSRPLRPWLLTVVRNKARDLLRSVQKHTYLVEQGTPTDMAVTNEQEVTRQEIDELLAVLNEDERRLCEEFYLEERSADEIAAVYGTARSEVYRRLHQIRTKLRARAHLR